MGYDEERDLLDVAADAIAWDERSSIRERGGPCPSRPKTRTRAPSGSSSTTATPSFVSVASRIWSVGKRRRLNWSCPPSSLTVCSSPGVPGAITLSRSSSRSRPTPSSAAEQALRDLLLVYLVRGEVANVLVLVLRPKGQLRVPDHARRPSSDAATELGGRWRVVELWTIPAEPVLATADPGMMPWVPLMQAAEPPEIVLRRCREVIDQHAPAEEHESLITVTQVFTRLRYKDPNLLSILGGKTVMIESPLIRELTAERSHKHILKLLATRFGLVPPELEAEVRSILDESVLDAAIQLAAFSPDLDHFAAELRAIPRPPEPWDPADEPEPNA